jgi:hypothetical protein
VDRGLSWSVLLVRNTASAREVRQAKALSQAAAPGTAAAGRASCTQGLHDAAGSGEQA